MKRKIFLLCHFFVVFLFVSCEKYEFPDSHLKMTKKQIIETIVGQWKLEKLLVNGIDTTNYLFSITNNELILGIDKDETPIKDRLTSELKMVFPIKDTPIFNSLFIVDKLRGLAILQPLWVGGYFEKDSLLNSLGPQISALKSENSFFILRELTTHRLVISDIDQTDYNGKSVTNLLIFKKL